ncbi:MFS transporter [Burkholderia anthina]|uniref:MFS transporter n=1 Tax=Burkholderia anthina TaxID=179879 RepID=UPI00158C873D|nr:MFS transporter [Burkholderia anthina]
MQNLWHSLKSGNWRALLACFLYFDTGFTVWVIYGPLAPFIGKSLPMTPAEQGFLVAVPVLSAAILRVAFGNLYQAIDGRRIALAGIVLSSLPALILPLTMAPSYTTLLLLGVFLGVGGASFAIALPMAGANYPPRMQGLVLGLAAAGNIGAVLDGFLFPGLAQSFGWRNAMFAAVPLLAIAAIAIHFWAVDPAPKQDRAKPAVIGFVATIAGLLALVYAVRAGTFGAGRAGVLLLPALGALLAVLLLPRAHRAVLGERDTWVVMLVYSITFGGYVGMSSYVSTLLTTAYGTSKITAGMLMALFALVGALLRPLGGGLADRVSGVRALTVLLAIISLCDLAFWFAQPGYGTAIGLMMVLYASFGLGNGATFQLVPHRWKGRTGLMSGVVGAAGGIGGFYLPVIMGIAKESTGTYQAGFGIFGAIAAFALILVIVLRRQWLDWSMPSPLPIKS